MTVLGIDIASYQGVPDFAQVTGAGYRFVLNKATEGTTYTNPRFAVTWPAIAAAGLARGVYHFAQPDQNTAKAEAAYFVQAIGALAQGDVLALDIEAGSGDLSAWVLAWLQAVDAATGVTPIIYSSSSFMAAHGLTGDTALSGYGLWLAEYGVPTPTVPAPWGFWALWQNSGNGTVPGIVGACDIDEFNGTVAGFKAYGYQPAPVKPTPTNNDLVYLAKFLFAPNGPDLAGLSAAIAPFL